MIKGDISGIQKFIYSDLEMTDNVAKLLRGRSFFVRLLSDAVANYILRELDIWEANLFFNNGGHFVMIAPNTNHNRAKLTDIERKINQWLFGDFGSELQLVIGSIEEGSSQLMEKFPKKMRELENVLQEKKRKKCFSILDQIMQSPINSKKNKEISGKYNKIFENLGTKLPKSDYLIEIVTGVNSSEKLWGISDINFLNISQNYYLASERELRDKLAELDSYNPLSMVIYNISDTDITRSVIGSSKNPVGYSFKFTGSYIPMTKNNERPMTFEELAEIESEDYPLIGVARMDVDSLGAIFAYGLKFVKRSQDDKPIYTPTRISFLSREMNHFFSGTLEKIARDNKIYLVYSGGDDLFAVGSWVKIIKFVQKVRKEFRQFACHNMNITLSCGVVIEKSDFPIVYSARASEDELDHAKSLTKEERDRKGEKDNKKDRISIFGRKVSWEKLEELLSIADKLLGIVDSDSVKKNEQIPRSFIHTLLETTQNCFDRQGKFQVDKVWQATSKIHYHFARRGVDAKEIEEKKDNYKREFGEYFLKKEAKELVDWYEHFAIPASYVLLKTRKSKK
jgi:CRISPR-associated protein Csm1